MDNPEASKPEEKPSSATVPVEPQKTPAWLKSFQNGVLRFLEAVGVAATVLLLIKGYFRGPVLILALLYLSPFWTLYLIVRFVVFSVITDLRGLMLNLWGMVPALIVMIWTFYEVVFIPQDALAATIGFFIFSAVILPAIYIAGYLLAYGLTFMPGYKDWEEMMLSQLKD